MEDRSKWPSKFDLVKDLGLSERTLERKIAAGELRREFRNVPGRKPISIIHPEDAAKLKAETLEAIPAEKSEVARKPPQGDMSSLVAALTDAFVAALSKAPQFQLSAPPKAPPTKLWLSLKEALEYSGLPEDYLKEKCEDRTIDAFRRSVKGRWYVRRESLERHNAVRFHDGGIERGASENN
jgi:hypothetical protein